MSTTLEEHCIEAKAAAKLYAETEADLLKLRVARRATYFGGKMATSAITIILGAVSSVILLISLGFVFADVFQNTALGFLCSGLVGLVLTAIAAVTMRKFVERFIIQSVLKGFFNV